MRSRPDTLGHEIIIVLVLKAAAILALWALFFSPAKRPAVDVHTVEGGVLGSAYAEPHDRRQRAR